MNLDTLHSALFAIARSHDNTYASMLLHGVRDLEDKQTRSKRDEVLVIMGTSTISGCLLRADLEQEQFVDPCSNAVYGLDGRLRKANKTEFYHLFAPPHLYKGDVLIIGEEAEDQVQIVDFTPDIMSLDKSDAEKLIEAILWKQLDIARALLKKENLITHQTKTGITALHVAAYRADPAFIKELVVSGLDVNQIGKDGITPIQLALLVGKDENAVALLTLGARVEAYCQGSRCTEAALNYLLERFPNRDKSELTSYLAGLQERAK